MSTIDPNERSDLTGTWSGFGFQRGHMFTPEGHSLMPEDMTWWSLTCNIAQEWRQMMAEARQCDSKSKPAAPKRKSPGKSESTVIHLRHVIRDRREKRVTKTGGEAWAEVPKVVPIGSARKASRRG